MVRAVFVKYEEGLVNMDFFREVDRGLSKVIGGFGGPINYCGEPKKGYIFKDDEDELKARKVFSSACSGRGLEVEGGRARIRIQGIVGN